MQSGRLEGESIEKIYKIIRERLPNGLSSIAIALMRIAISSFIMNHFPEVFDSFKFFKEALLKGDTEDLEKALSSLYITLHGAGTFYSDEEKDILRSMGGYLCYPGGLYPILIAGDFVRNDSVVADLGSGNGLQGLLLQWLYPHRKTIQIEISNEMIRVGKLYQKALGIDEVKVEWINDHILEAPFEEADLLYIYRPARPVEGEALYRGIAERLLNSKKAITIFSVADCLAPFLNDSFKIHYDDGHLKVFINY